MREFCSGRQAYYLTGRRTLQNEDGTWFHLPPLMCLRWLAFIQSMSTFRRGGMLSDLDMWWIDPFFKPVNNGGPSFTRTPCGGTSASCWAYLVFTGKIGNCKRPIRPSWCWGRSQNGMSMYQQQQL